MWNICYSPLIQWFRIQTEDSFHSTACSFLLLKIEWIFSWIKGFAEPDTNGERRRTEGLLSIIFLVSFWSMQKIEISVVYMIIIFERKNKHSYNFLKLVGAYQVIKRGNRNNTGNRCWDSTYKWCWWLIQNDGNRLNTLENHQHNTKSRQHNDNFCHQHLKSSASQSHQHHDVTNITVNIKLF